MLQKSPQDHIKNHRKNLPEKDLTPCPDLQHPKIFLKDPNIQQFLDINTKYHKQTQNFAKEKSHLMNNLNENKRKSQQNIPQKGNKENKFHNNDPNTDQSTALNTNNSGSKQEENLQDSLELPQPHPNPHSKTHSQLHLNQSPVQAIIQTMKNSTKAVPMSSLNKPPSHNNINIFQIKNPMCMKQSTPVLMQKKTLVSSIKNDSDQVCLTNTSINQEVSDFQQNFTQNSINTQEDMGKQTVIHSVKNRKTNQQKGHVLFGPNTQTLEKITYAKDASNKGLSDLNTLNLTKKENIQALHSLDLSINKFSDIPNTLSHFKNLKILKLDNNFIKAIPPSFFSELKLETFSIMNNLIRSIPEQIINWKYTLQSLNIAKNHISEFQPNICEMTNLKVLIVSSNDFEFLPRKFLNLQNCLKELAIDWLKYTQTAKEAKEPRELRDEVARGDTIKKVFEIIRQLPPQTKCVTTEYFLHKMSENYDSNLSILNSKQRNQMHQCVVSEDISMLRYLLSSNLNLSNQLDSEGHTPLSLAIRQEKYFCAKIMIFANVNINIGGGPLGSCLNLGVIKQQQYLVRDLLKMGADVNARDKEGNTSLHYLFAVFNKDKEESQQIAELLLLYNADPDIENDEGHSPIHIAARKGSQAAIMFILNYNKDKRNRGKKLFTVDKVGGEQRHSILHMAAFNGHTELVSTLLKECPEAFSKSMAVNLQINMSSKNNTISKLMKIAEKKFINHHILKIPLQKGEKLPQIPQHPQPPKNQVNQIIELSQDMKNLDINLRKRPLTPIKPRTLQKQMQPSSQQTGQDDDASFAYISSSSDSQIIDEDEEISSNFELKKRLDFDNLNLNSNNLQLQNQSDSSQRLEIDFGSDSEEQDQIEEENHHNTSNGIITETFNFDPKNTHKILPNKSQFKLKHGSQYQPFSKKLEKPTQNQESSNTITTSSSSEVTSKNKVATNDSFEDFDVEDFLEESEWPLMHCKGMPYITEKDMGCCSLSTLSNRKRQKSTNQIIKENLDRKLKNLISNCYHITEIRQRILQKNILPKKLSCLYSLFGLHNSIQECISNITNTPLYTLQKQGINKILSPLELEKDSRLVFLLNNAWIIVETMKEVYELLTSEDKNKFQSTCLYAKSQHFNINDEFDCTILQQLIASKYPSQNLASQNRENLLSQYMRFHGIQTLNDSEKQQMHHKFLITESGFEKFFPLEEEKIQQIGDSIKIYKNEKKRVNPLMPRQYI